MTTKEPKTKENKINEDANPRGDQEALTPKEKKEVKVIERIIENREIAPVDAFGKLTRPQVELIKRTIAKGASDDELRMFIQVCKGAQLNPFLRQVHLVPRWDNREGREVRSIQVSIDGFRSIAESSGAYAGNDDPIFEGEKEIEVPKGKDKTEKMIVPLAAKSVVRKIVQGAVYEFSATARWDEYYPGPKMGFQWHIRPHLMLGKCSEALALRKAFPKLLSGMYAQEEMDRTSQADAETEKTQKGFSALMDAVEKSSITELEEYKAKITASDRYSAQQKAMFTKAADDRIARLKKAEEVPMVNVET